jgi:preprotein translocase subunit YajC
MEKEIEVGDTVLVKPGFTGQVKRVLEERFDVQIGNEILPFKHEDVSFVFSVKEHS